MTPDKARELWADVLADYQETEWSPSKRDRAITFALYILAEENEFYGSEITLLANLCNLSF